MHIDNNKLEALPNEIGQLQNLQELHLYLNPLSSKEKERIRRLLPKCEIHFEEYHI
ncbi:leucine rich repeat protein [Leptospira weilii str. UI 13098]|uniref:Leucine rich repeat protein n=1 Tax=Leptospira weilii str. UI 13098 TaxID=1088542 RepID=M6Q683_9LEPT|nr:leucine rich repeat protein [Leptospira weilii str. UI 13098]